CCLSWKPRFGLGSGRLHGGLAGFQPLEILYVEVVQPCAPGCKDDETEVDTAMIPGNYGGNQKVDRRKGREKTDKGSPQPWRSGWVHNQARPQQHGPPEREHSGLRDDLERIHRRGIPQQQPLNRQAEGSETEVIDHHRARPVLDEQSDAIAYEESNEKQ